MIYRYIVAFYILCFGLHQDTNNQEIVVDSNFTFEEAIKGSDAPKNILKNLVLVDVKYYSYDDKIHQGQILIHKNLIKDIHDIFEIFLKYRFPIEKVIPICVYNWDDQKSMLDNNTSGFNYRKVRGSRKLSHHAYGRAIDINPFNNPYVGRTGNAPSGSTYNIKQKGTLVKNSDVVKDVLKLGWNWGGNWKRKDYQHFEKK